MSTHFHVSGTGVTGPLARRSGNYKWWVLATAIFGAFVSILDTTIVNTALPHIQRAFGSDLHVASYVTTAYTLAQGVIFATPYPRVFPAFTAPHPKTRADNNIWRESTDP